MATTSVTRHTALGYYTADCDECGQLGKTPTSRYMMVAKCEEHDFYHVVQQIVDALTDKHNLARVQVVLSNKKGSNFGRAYLLKRVMDLNNRLSPAMLDNTIRHEVAHFMAWDLYDCADHSDAWKACAVICGADPKATTHVDHTNAIDAGARWIYTCGQGCAWARYKRSKLYDNGLCRAHGLRLTAVPSADYNA